MNDITKLKVIRNVTLILSIIGAGFMAGRQYYLGMALIVIAIYIEWKLYRCPHCDKRLDTRMHLDWSTHCSYCGDIISLPKNYKMNK